MERAEVEELTHPVLVFGEELVLPIETARESDLVQKRLEALLGIPRGAFPRRRRDVVRVRVLSCGRGHGREDEETRDADVLVVLSGREQSACQLCGGTGE